MVDLRTAAERYLWRAERYVRNASAFLIKGEADKAGECLWGAIALAFKAVALSRIGRRLRSHQSLRTFAGDLARLQGDPTLVAYFDSAEILHRNFYEADHTPEDVQIRLDTLRPFLHRLFNLARIPKP